MFQLAEMTRMVRVPPWNFKGKLDDAASDELNKKLANKVVLDVGLCIALFDVISLEDSYIFPGDGSSHTRVTFRFIVFRPFMEEILEGVIKSQNAEGLQISLGFFEDIYIRKDALTANSRYDETENIWIWEYENEGNVHPLYMNIGKKIRFKVLEEQFTDTTPSDPSEAKVSDKEQAVASYIIYGATNDDGLGMLSWWSNETEADEEDEEEEEETEENV